MNRLLLRNPVLLRELQERVLSRRTMIMITLWVSLLCLITSIYYIGEVSNTFGNQFDPFGGSVLRLARVGQNMFDWLLFFMIGLVLFLVPGFTAASIAGERERQTLLPMQVTLLRPIDIVVGKIAASVVFVLVLVAVATPILAFAYLIGGITIGEVFISLAMLTFSALAIACLTVACSALVRRVPGAIVTAYGMVLVLTLGSIAVFGVWAAIDDSRGFDPTDPPLTLLAVNPVVAIADVSDSGQANDRLFGGSSNPMGGLRSMLDEVRFQGNRNFGPFPDDVIFVEGPDGFPVPVPAGFDNGDVRQARSGDGTVPYWVQYLIVMGGLSALSIWIAVRSVRTPARVER